MNLLRADHLGMCFGVRDALALAEAEAARGPATILGQLVHNEHVLARLRAQGLRLETDLAVVTTETVVVTAHGTSDRHREEIRASGRRMLDATCPLVHVAHRALGDLVRRGYHPVVIGQRDHVEVRGLTGDHPQCDVILHESDVDRMAPRDRFGVVSQTTQPLDRVRTLVDVLRRRFPQSEVVFRDTVCLPTKQRQSAAESLARRSDVVVVLGGAHSNNTRELVATCLRSCARVHHIQTAADLDPEWFRPTDTVGLTAGTSTPDDLIRSVEERLQAFARRSVASEPLSLSPILLPPVSLPVASA
ncbi:MAG: 4-hydroxy-3-methylbut-2-enyl diphosphate reductase [Verrucomicrobiales bacterium]|nr:4-hydroxy-3-methylbut-2-enyl diphosphate reductase [Verrucomicrobiales bacterium]